MTLFNTQVVRATGQRLALVAIAVAPALFAAPVGAQQSPLQQALTAQTQVDKDAQQSQKTVDGLRDRAQDAAGKYAQMTADAESLERYNAQLDKQVKSQEAEIASIQQQIDDIETTNREVQPLMQQMVDALAQFVKLDTPFLLEERTNRVQSLRDMMARADVTISEKYRRILEAYQIELEYGRTFDSYQGKLGNGADARTVQFVRLGRVSLMYLTLDGEETGYWDAQKKQWVADNSYAEQVREALRIAQKRGQPDLLTVPVPAPQEVRS